MKQRPIAENCIEMGLMFIAAHQENAGRVTMGEGGIFELSTPRRENFKNPIHSCGTSACFAGWFSIINENIAKNHIWDYCYDSGKKQMAKFLGFEDPVQLKDWAQENTDLWGRSGGENMFCGTYCFGSTDLKINLDVIGEYWVEVGLRIQEAEQVAQ